MTRQFQCKGCHHERTEPESEHPRKGYCSACNAKVIGLPQIKKVEKYEARDGTMHDSFELAEKQLMRDLKDALGACKGREEDQAGHSLYHFDIVRKGDKLPSVIYGPATVKKVLHLWSFFIGAAIATSVMLYLFR
ncbi:hypothetical protein [Pseudomonas tolaasii]